MESTGRASNDADNETRVKAALADPHLIQGRVLPREAVLLRSQSIREIQREFDVHLNRSRDGPGGYFYLRGRDVAGYLEADFLESNDRSQRIFLLTSYHRLAGKTATRDPTIYRDDLQHIADLVQSLHQLDPRASAYSPVSTYLLPSPTMIHG